MKVILHPATPLPREKFEPLDPARVISGAPATAHDVFYTSSSSEMVTGIWQCTPGKWRISYTEDEFCTLIEGEIVLAENGGEAQHFKAPASFLIPAGYQGTWEALTDVRKFFVIYEKQTDGL